MQKNYHKYLLFSLIILIACTNQLNIEPDNIIVENDVFKSEMLVDRALGNTYYTFYNAATNGMAYILGDITTDNTECSDFFERYNNGDLQPTESGLLDMWSEYYAAINEANNIIVNVPLLATYDQSIKDSQVAEAKFIRAYSYLELLKLFGHGALSGNTEGLGLPLQLTPFEGYTSDKLIPRSTNRQVYDQIIKDLTEAYDVLPVTYSSDLDTRTRATKGAVNALLSRIYLYLKEYGQAGEKAKLVLDDQSTYSLSDDLLKVFPPNPDVSTVQPMTKEHIFAFPVSGDNMGDNNIGFFYFYKRSIWINDDFIGLYEPNDLRADTLVFDGYIPNPPSSEPVLLERVTTYKFNERNQRDNVSMIRLAEIMLTRAEALARTSGVNQESVDLLNMVRNRAFKEGEKPDPFEIDDFTSGPDLVDRILLERRFELAFEGQYRYDLIRTDSDLKNPDLTENQKVLPIPQFEIDISEGVLKQNPQ